MSFTWVERPALTAIGPRIRTHNGAGMEGAATDIPQLWARFEAEAWAARLEGAGLLGIYCNYSGDHTQPYDFAVACAVAADKAVPQGAVRYAIPAGRYARFAIAGPMPQAVVNAWMLVWQLSESGALKRAFTLDYELYDAEGAAIYIAA